MQTGVSSYEGQVATDINFLILKTGKRGLCWVHSIEIAHTLCKELYLILLKVNVISTETVFCSSQ
jgi:hypothetical protein